MGVTYSGGRVTVVNQTGGATLTLNFTTNGSATYTFDGTVTAQNPNGYDLRNKVQTLVYDGLGRVVTDYFNNTTGVFDEGGATTGIYVTFTFNP